MGKRTRILISLMMLSFTTLPAQTTIPGGDVSGTWTAAGSPYQIQGNIVVQFGDTLTIGPGVDVIFQGYYRLQVNGILEAIGTESDSISFLPSDTTMGWRGLYFLRGGGVSMHLRYCRIEYAYESGIQVRGVALHLQVSHCTIAHCRSSSGGGIYVSGVSATLHISDSFIAHNTAEASTGGKGGGISVSIGTLVMDRCTVHANRAVIPSPDVNYVVRGGGIFLDSNAPDDTISGSSITDNFIGLSNGGMSIGGTLENDGGAGIFSKSDEAVTITHCLISGNHANAQQGAGGGIFIDLAAGSTTISRCLFNNNWLSKSGYGGAGIYAQRQVDIVNCTFHANHGSSGAVPAISLLGSPTNFINNVVARNGRGIKIPAGSSNMNVRYNDILDECTDMPAGFGVLDTVNANGDSCDVFHNIFLDPMFVDTAKGDLHLLEGSPCIDAGDPDLPRDPDSTITDVGCCSFDQRASAVQPYDPTEHSVITTFELHQNYPNPFNPSTGIRYQVSGVSDVSLRVFDLLGREVATLVNERKTPGVYEVRFDASVLPSGVYFCRMTAGAFCQTRKLLLLK